MDGRPTWTDCDEAGDYVVPNVLSPRDLVFRPDNMDETVPHTQLPIECTAETDPTRQMLRLIGVFALHKAQIRFICLLKLLRYIHGSKLRSSQYGQLN